MQDTTQIFETQQYNGGEHSRVERNSGIVAIVSIVAVVILGITTATVMFSNSSKNSEKHITEPILIALAEDAVTTTVATTTEPPEPPIVIPPADERLAKSYTINKDVIGWLTIDGTSVDEEILQGPDNAYYLTKDINKNYLFAGSLYADFRDDFGYSTTMQSDQMVIYGHNMLNGSKFGTLKYYRLDPTYIDQYPIVNISNRYRSYEYVIFAGINTRENGEEGIEYWKIHDFDNSEDFQKYYEFIQKRNLLKDSKTSKAVDIVEGDKILALSTCSQDGYRWVTYARRLRDNETADMFLPVSEEVTTTTTAN
ncbi:hypothetical protein FACS1894132_05090 [Clostridia bacterium]|nr:hypothetical protein FACS1894132_05090 [Clostridia bacterium]